MKHFFQNVPNILVVIGVHFFAAGVAIPPLKLVSAVFASDGFGRGLHGGPVVIVLGVLGKNCPKRRVFAVNLKSNASFTKKHFYR
jgi:hypothetical protein